MLKQLKEILERREYEETLREREREREAMKAIINCQSELKRPNENITSTSKSNK